MIMSNNSMTVITSKPFGSLNVDVYEDNKHEYYMTREQIGRALEYTDPVRNISKIHDRNADRLNKLSTVVKLTTVEGGITKHRDIMVYNLRGVMEICRLSRQPKADKFMDFCWDVMESLMRGDSVLASPKMDAALTPDFIQAQFVALMEKQAGLDKKMKYLNDRMGRVFDKMEDTRGLGFSKMEKMIKAYSRMHGRNPIPKTKVFLENDSAMYLFKKTVKKLMKEVGEN